MWFRFIVVLAVSLPIISCASARGAPMEFLDERTGTTVTVVRKPLTFALERSTLAAHARDYASLTALEVDRSGEPQLYLIAYFWSTIDRRASAAPAPSTGQPLSLFADGRLIRLTPTMPVPKDLTDTPQLLAPQTARFEQSAYLVTLEQLRYLASSRNVTLTVGRIFADDDDDEAETYEIWSDARGELKNFVEAVVPAG